MDPSFPEISGVLGFGCMRFPKKDKDIDVDAVKKMFDLFLANGFNYFDTAHGYHGGRSETTIREALTSRWPRSRYLLTDKLTDEYFASEADIRPFFESQLEACGVDYFDFYLMHSQTAQVFEYFKERRAYETALALKEEGKIRHFGISFHDRADVLDRILTEYPEIEIVQIQFNYADYDDSYVESRRVYETARRHGKPLIVMEPLKGGGLVKLPEAGQKLVDALPTGPDMPGGTASAASLGLRFAAGFEGIRIVLSGMSAPEQVESNAAILKSFRPLDDAERDAIRGITDIYHSLGAIPCTGCRYCVDQNTCPENILIPDLFSCLNSLKVFNDWNMPFYYENTLTVGNGKASSCIGCGGCEQACPQHLPIRDLLKNVAAAFEDDHEIVYPEDN